MAYTTGRSWLLLAVAASALACSHTAPFYRVPATQPQNLGISSPDIGQRIVLVGDAGDYANGSHLLSVLGNFLSAGPLAKTAVVFLGDSFYAKGPTIPQGSEAANALDAQLRVGLGAQRVLFVAGNHDWEDGFTRPGFARGLAKAANLRDYIESSNRNPAGELHPRPSCPGPHAVSLPGVKLILLDSEWWFLDEAERTQGAITARCGNRRAADAVADLRAELACPAGQTCAPRIVVSHHPLASSGKHAAVFPLHEYFFCFGFLPLPPVCSANIVARKLGIARQDIPSSTYRAYVSDMRHAMRANPPLAFAAGHEHGLQVIDGPVVPALLVSGSGALVDWVGHAPETRFSQAERGFMVLDFLNSGRVALRVYSLRKDPGDADAQAIQDPIYAEFLR